MANDGLSPEPALVGQVRRATSLPIRVMLRLREGFSTDGGEVTRLQGLLSSYRSVGADGVVLGFLNAHTEIDAGVVLEIVGESPGFGWTFHRAVDSCFDTNGHLIASGPDVWAGVLDDAADGACTQEFDINSSSRREAGGPFRGGVFKCQLQSVAAAIANGTYGSWQPDAAQQARLEQIFPTGVCDWSKPGVGQQEAISPLTFTAGPGGVPLPPPPTVQSRRH